MISVRSVSAHTMCASQDLTTSLQHKQHETGRLKRREANRTRKAASTSSPFQDDESIDILAESHPTFPLWRRATKQFWWNEWMLQPLIDAGVSSCTNIWIRPVLTPFPAAFLRYSSHARFFPDFNIHYSTYTRRV